MRTRVWEYLVDVFATRGKGRGSKSLLRRVRKPTHGAPRKSTGSVKRPERRRS